MTQQVLFGGPWTQQKLDALSKYLRAYTRIFTKNPRARHFRTSYVDAFAGTGALATPEGGLFEPLLPPDVKAVEEYRKGSVRRALEVEPPFDRYVFIEKDAAKCQELEALKEEFSEKEINVVNEDANSALLKWCKKLDTKRERAVVFLDPFGASVEWQAISALARTRAVDLWILFPYFAINRMLIRNRKPPKRWADRLTRALGTPKWEEEFYSTTSWQSLLDEGQQIEQVYKTADQNKISEFFVKQLSGEFEAVSRPLPLYNSNGALLFLFYFAAGNKKSAETGMKIAEHILGK